MMGLQDKIANMQADLDAKSAQMKANQARRLENLRGAPPAPDTADPGQEVDIVSYKKLADYERDAKKRVKAGWHVETHVEQERRVAKGRTLGRTVMTGGIGLVIGGRSRKGDAITITWVR
jgi:hypothetical protein